MSWKNPPTNFTLEIIKQSEELLRKAAGETLQGVVNGSPVDTGTFRGNHLVSLNEVDNAFDVSVRDKSGSATIAKGMSTILQAKIGDVIYIQNNLPYAVALENGHSQQAPFGVYSIAYLNAKNKFGL